MYTYNYTCTFPYAYTDILIFESTAARQFSPQQLQAISVAFADAVTELFSRAQKKRNGQMDDSKASVPPILKGKAINTDSNQKFPGIKLYVYMYHCMFH